MIESLLVRYGLLAIFLGAGLEGEAVVLSGGVIAQRGFVTLPAAMTAATLGSFLIDQLWFLAGRRFRHHCFIQHFTTGPRFTRALDTLARHPVIFILSFRFIYGMRTISPIAIGVSEISARRFVILNAIAATIWAPLFTWLGFRYGEAALALAERIAFGSLRVGAFAAAAILAVLLWMRLRNRKY